MATDIIKIMKILVIGDIIVSAKNIQTILAESDRGDVEIRSAESLDSAFQILKGFPCDIILLDLNIKDSAGLDTFIKIKQKHPAIPVIIITDEYKNNTDVKAVAMGVQDFFIKNNLDSSKLKKAVYYAIERKRLEKEHFESEARWRQLVQNASDIIINIAYDGTILFINKNAPWISAKNNLGQNIYKLLSSAYHAKIKYAIDKVFKYEKVISLKITVVRANRSVGYFTARLNPIKKEAKVVAANITITDISELIKLEKQIHQSRTLDSIGTLAAGVAHEINTPIQYIQDNTIFFNEEVINLFEIITTIQKLMADKQDEKISTIIEKVKEAMKDADIEYLKKEIPSAISQSLDGIDRVKKIINAMKFFSRVDSDEMIKADINQAIESTVMVSKNEWKYVADVETDLDPLIPEIKCFISGINQTLMNIIVNAAHAISDVVDGGSKGKGVITISSKKENGSIVIMIKDTGAGIPDNIRDRIFDPFFTTKEVGKGTGQGLAIAYDIIVKIHKGSIDVESKVGEGSIFTIRLPIVY